MSIAVSVKYLGVKMEFYKFVLCDGSVKMKSLKTKCVNCGKC